MTDHRPDPHAVPTPSSEASEAPVAPHPPAVEPGPPPGASAGSPALPVEPAAYDAPAQTAAVVTATWNPLPERALAVFVIGELPFAILCLFLFGGPTFAGAFLLTSSIGLAFSAGLLAALLGAGFALWLSVRRFRRTFWRLDETGLSLREGRLWQHEIRVPATRVQHLDLQRGPLQRQRRLATLEVHTAGSRHGAVTVPHLDEDDAERLRDALGRQVDRDLDD